MSTPTKIGPAMRRRTMAYLPQEIKYWANILGCSEIEVKPAVKKMLGIGPSKKDNIVGNNLKNKRYRMIGTAR